MKYDSEIFLFVDALGWEVVSRTGFMADELPFRRKIEMQFGYSSTAIPTILSGKSPAEHGHLGLFRFAPESSPFRALRFLAPLMKPESFWNRGRVRHQLSKLIGRCYGFTGYFQLYRMPFRKLPLMDYCEKRDLFAPGGMEETENLHDLLLRSGVPFHISDWRAGDAKNFQAAGRAVREGKRFLFLYTAELDAMLHRYPSPEHEKILEKLRWYRERILELMNLCRASGRRTRLTVISDHGMTPLTGTADIMSALERTPLVFGRDYGACFDSTMLRVTLLRPEAEAVIREALAPFASSGHWLTQEEEKRYGIYRSDRRFGDMVFLMNPGVQIVPSDMGASPLAGMHGFAPEDRDSMAAVLSDDEIPPEIRRVADYFRLMADRIGALAAAGEAGAVSPAGKAAAE